MAKSKKKKSALKLYVALGALLFGVVATCMMFVLAISAEGVGDFTGLQVAFGYTSSTDVIISTVETKVLNANFLAMLGYLLPVVGGVLAVLLAKNKSVLVRALPALVCFVGGAVLLFLMPTYFINGVANENYVKLLEALEAGATLEIGAILGGVFACLGGLTVVAKEFV